MICCMRMRRQPPVEPSTRRPQTKAVSSRLWGEIDDLPSPLAPSLYIGPSGHSSFRCGRSSSFWAVHVLFLLPVLCLTSSSSSSIFAFSSRSAARHPTSHRPRLLLSGRPGSGQTTHVAPAVLHALEKFTVYTLDMASLFGDCTTSAEQACCQVWRRKITSIWEGLEVRSFWCLAISQSVYFSLFLSLPLSNFNSFAPHWEILK